jgi:hypothetical protein
VDRASFGLSALKPSEMIAGLDEAAKRAEKMEAREEAKRRAGGRMSANIAVLVDDTGQRWKKAVNVGILVTVAAVLIGGGTMMYYSNPWRQKLDPRAGNIEAGKMLSELKARAEGLRGASDADSLTAETARERLQKEIEVNYKSVCDQIERAHDAATANGRKNWNPDPMIVRDRAWLEKLKDLKDPFGQPIEFKLEGDTLVIGAKGTTASGTKPPDSVRIRLRGKGPAEKGAR